MVQPAWLHSRLHDKTVSQLEFDLHILLLPQHDADWLLDSANGDPVSQPRILKGIIRIQEFAPHCQILRQYHELVAQLIDRSQECRADSTAAPRAIAALQLWMQAELAELPTTCLTARLRDDLMSSQETDAHVLALVHALETAPDLVNLNESNHQSNSIIHCILDLDASHLRLLGPVIPQLLARIGLMTPMMMHQSPGKLALRRLFAPTLMNFAEAEFDAHANRPATSSSVSIVVADQRPFFRLQLALLDVSLSRDPSNAARTVEQRREDDLLPYWFEQLAMHLETHPGCVTAEGRLVRELMDHLRLPHHRLLGGRITTVGGRAFEEFVLDRPDGAREWLASHEGSDWYDLASSMQRFIRHHLDTSPRPRPSLLPNAFPSADRWRLVCDRKVVLRRLDSELPLEIEAWIKAMQQVLEVHLIPDLARVAFSFLRSV